MTWTERLYWVTEDLFMQRFPPSVPWIIIARALRYEWHLADDQQKPQILARMSDNFSRMLAVVI